MGRVTLSETEIFLNFQKQIPVVRCQVRRPEFLLLLHFLHSLIRYTKSERLILTPQIVVSHLESSGYIEGVSFSFNYSSLS